MDPVSLGIAVAALMATKAVEKLGEDLGQGVAGAISTIWNRLHRWIIDTDDQELHEVVVRLEARPTRKARVDELADVLAERFAKNTTLAQELNELLTRAQQGNSAVASFVANVRDNARVGKIIQIGSAANIRLE